MFNTAFSYTKSKWHRWPVIETNNVSDVSQVEKYQGQYPYVWLKNKNYEILDTFNWNFSPEEQNRNKIHTFPLCNKKTKRPQRWDVLCLVPTSATNETEVESTPFIASYDTQSQSPIYIYTFSDKRAVKKYAKFEFENRSVHLIKNKQSMDRVYNLLNNSDPLWLIDADVTINNVEDLNFTRSDADIYMFNVMHKSTGLVYADESVQFINPSYMEILRGTVKREPRIEKVDTIIGTLNDIEDPFKAWARAYSTFMYLNKTKLLPLKRSRSRILGKYMSLDGSRVEKMARAGVEEAEKFVSSDEYQYNKLLTWDILEKRFQKFLQPDDVKPDQQLLERKLKKAIAIYGKDSDEYQKLSSQLEKSSGSL